MTPEERAEARWPDDIKATHLMPYSDCSANQIAKRVGCICCIREQVEPLEAENANLRALVQVLVDGMAGHARSCVGTCSCGFYGRIASALIAAKEQGFAPTNTEDNG